MRRDAGAKGEGREDIWGGRGRRGRGFGGFDGVLVSLISFDSSGMVLGNQILVVEPAVMHRVPPPLFSLFFLVARCPFRGSRNWNFFGPWESPVVQRRTAIVFCSLFFPE